MTTRFTRTAGVLSAAVALALGSLAHAAETRPGDPTGRSATSPASPAGAPAATVTGQARPDQAAVRDVRMSELIGMDVRNERGERLGDVNDLVVDPVTGQVAYAVVGAGGFLGIGEKLSAFPMRSFKIARGDARGTAVGADRVLDNDGVRGDKGPIGSDRTASSSTPGTTATAPADRTASSAPAAPASRMLPGRSTRDLQLVLNADPKQLKDAPNFDRDRWPDWNDSTFRSGVDRAAGVNAPPVAAGQTGKLVRASQLMDADIRDTQNKDIGEIEDLVVDMNSGRVHYAVVEFERGWFESDKLVALPMNALRPSGDKGELVFSGDRSRLSQAPSFEKTAWPDLNSPSYRGDLDRYMASWGGAVPGSATTAEQTDRSRGTTAAVPGTPTPGSAAPGTRAPSSGTTGSPPPASTPGTTTR